jgi:Zn-dependent M32 family carboxypeptidase
MKKAAFAQVLAKATNTPEYKSMKRLSAEGIGSRSDVEMTLQQMSQKILQSPEIAKALEGSSEPYDLKFLPDGNVVLKKADGTERTFKLDGNLKETAQKAVSIIENAKVAYSGGVASSKEIGGTLHIVPGSKTTLIA